MKTILSLTAAFAFASTAAIADTRNYQSIIGDAAKIQQNAQAISLQLKNKQPDFEALKAQSEALNGDIKELRGDLAAFESSNPNLTEQQKKDWELVKTKAELLVIFSDQKSNLLNSGDLKKNRWLLRAHANGIAKRAELLQQTAKRLSR